MSDTMGSGDALSQAQATISANKAATLAALAKGGQAAADSYSAAQSSNTAAKTAALQAQLGTLGNSPAQFTGAQQAILAQPFNAAASNLTQMGQARQDYMANLSASSGASADSAINAIPAMRQAAHNALLASNSKLAQATITANTNLQLKQLELQVAQQNAANSTANLSPFTATSAGAAEKALGTTQGDQGAALYGLGSQQNTADQAAQAAAMQNITPNPMGYGAAGVSAALPTVDLSNPGVVSGFTTNPDGSTTPINATPTGFNSTAGGPGQMSQINTPNGATAGQDVASATQELNRLLAQLGVTGAAGVVPGETVNAATGRSGGIPAISPALASQLYDASSGGVADRTALTAANTAATAAAKTAALPPTTAAIKSSPQYQVAQKEFTTLMKAKGATALQVYGVMQQPHQVNGTGPTINYDMPVLQQMMADQAALSTHAAAIPATP